MICLAFSESVSLADLAMIAALGIFAMIAIVNFRKIRHMRRGGNAPQPRENLERMKQNAAMKDDLRQMMVDLEKLTRHFSAQLDAKSQRIEILMQQADKKIEQLGMMVDDQVGPRTHEPAKPDQPLTETVQQLRAMRHEIAQATPQVAPDHADSPLTHDPLGDSVYALADQGHSPVEIAKQLDEHVGKIELILALRKN